MTIDLEETVESFNFFQYPVPIIASEEGKSQLQSKLGLEEEIEAENRFTLFVSIPYCKSRCNSCVFYKNPMGLKSTQESVLDSYLESLLKQINDYSNTNRFRNAELKSVYIGGGTASLLFPRQVSDLVAKIQDSFVLSPEVEITFEANPLHLNKDYLNAIRESGVTRVSVGVQSFNDETLNVIGSPHNATHSFRAIKGVMSMGFKTVNIDLLYGVLGQSEEQWSTDLERVMGFETQSITLYGYKVHPGSRTERLIKKGKFKEQISNEGLPKYYLLASVFLVTKGYVEDDFGCFVKPGHEQQYRLNSYKLGCESIGIGAGAYSYINGYLFVSPQNAKEFMREIKLGNCQTANKISPKATKKNRMERYIMHNLHSGNIDRVEFSKIFGNDLLHYFPHSFESFERQSLINLQKSSIKVTNLGKIHLNSMMREFYLSGVST